MPVRMGLSGLLEHAVAYAITAKVFAIGYPWLCLCQSGFPPMEHGGPFLFIARVAVSSALHGTVGVEPAPEPKDKKQDRWKARRKRTS
jgi:hypothetical protein